MMNCYAGPGTAKANFTGKISLFEKITPRFGELFSPHRINSAAKTPENRAFYGLARFLIYIRYLTHHIYRGDGIIKAIALGDAIFNLKFHPPFFILYPLVFWHRLNMRKSKYLRHV
jgi:hypothetical protein